MSNEQLIEKYVDQAIVSIKEVYPALSDAVLGAVQLDGAGHLLGGVGDFIVGTIMVILTKYFWKRFEKSKCIDKCEHEQSEPLWSAAAVITGVISIICFYAFLYQFFNIWNYVAIKQPKLYIAHQLMEKIEDRRC